MPVARYFLFVGGVLLALLFALDAFAPQQVAVASNSAGSIDKTVVRIRSDQKPPERVVYDMSLPTIVPPAAKTQVAAAPAAPIADINAQARVRDTFAQFVPAEAKKLEKRPSRRLRASARSPRLARFSPAADARCPAAALWLWLLREQHLVRVRPPLADSRAAFRPGGFDGYRGNCGILSTNLLKQVSRSSSSFTNRHSLTLLAAAGLGFGCGA